MTSLKPTPKVVAGGIGGAVSIILVWLIEVIFSVEVPVDVAQALTVIVSFTFAWVTKDPPTSP